MMTKWESGKVRWLTIFDEPNDINNKYLKKQVLCYVFCLILNCYVITFLFASWRFVLL